MALAICGVFALIWAPVLVYKFVHLGYYDWDLAFFTQACWRLLHGSQYVPLVGINYFGDHAYFVTFLVLPLFALFPHPLTLVFLKLAAYLISAFLLYRLMRRFLPEGLSMALMTAYLLLPANGLTLLFEFNPESLSMPFVLLLFDAFERRRWKNFWISAIVLLSIKENFALLTAAFAVFGLLQPADKGQKRQAGLLLAISLSVFYILAVVVIPWLRHSPTHAFVVRYSYLGSSLGEIARNLFLEPGLVLAHLFNETNGKFIMNLCGPWLFPALLGWPVLAVVSPLLLQHLLADYAPEHSIFFHYGLTLSPLLFLAAAQGLAFLKARLRPGVFKFVLAVLFVTALLQALSYGKEFVNRMDYHQDRLTAARWAMLSKIPKQAGVVATFDFLAPLSARSELYAFHKIYDGFYQDPAMMKESELNVRQKFVLPNSVSYALIDFNDRWMASVMDTQGPLVKHRIIQFLKGWRQIGHMGTLYLFAR